MPRHHLFRTAMLVFLQFGKAPPQTFAGRWPFSLGAVWSVSDKLNVSNFGLIGWDLLTWGTVSRRDMLKRWKKSKASWKINIFSFLVVSRRKHSGNYTRIFCFLFLSAPSGGSATRQGLCLFCSVQSLPVQGLFKNIQQIFMECLLSAKACSPCCGCRVNKTRTSGSVGLNPGDAQ